MATDAQRAAQKRYRAKNKAVVYANWNKWSQTSKGKASARRRHQSWYYSEKGQAWHRRRGVQKYGLTVEEYDALWAAQDCKCAACGTSETTQKRGWHVDHDHETNVVRAILCRACNVTLGNARNCPHRLRQLADYIEKHRGLS